MNEIATETLPVTVDPVDGKHYVLTLDAEGNEVKVEIVPTGEASQGRDEAAAEAETEVPTLH